MSAGRATDQAIAKIKDLISSGEFTAGSRLPTERELTQRFGVSRSSLREATRALALVGVLEARVGDGTYVTTLEPELLLTGVGFVSDLVSVASLSRSTRSAGCSSRRRRVWPRRGSPTRTSNGLGTAFAGWSTPATPRLSSRRTPTSTR